MPAVRPPDITGESGVTVPEGITLTVGWKEYTGCTLTADSF